MKRPIRWLSLLLILTLLPVGVIPRAEAASEYFTDIPDTATRQAADLLYRLGIVSGSGGTNYSPNSRFDRAALAVIGTRLSGTFDVSSYGGIVRFSDVRATHWAYRWINAASAEGIMAGGTDGLFHPGDPLTYGHLVTVLVKLLDYDERDVGYNWPHSYIAKAESLGLSKGLSFTANHQLTRGEAARIIYNFLFTPVSKGIKPYLETELGVSVVSSFIQGELAMQLIKDGNVLAVIPDSSVTYVKTVVTDSRGVGFGNGSLLPETSEVDIVDSVTGTPRKTWDEGEPVTLCYREDKLVCVIRDSVSVLLRMETSGNSTYIGDYPVKGSIDASLSGQTGWLKIDTSGNAIGFTVSNTFTYRTATIKETRSSGFTDSEGSRITVSASTPLWSSSGMSVWNSPGMNDDPVWMEILPGEVLLAAYNSAGTLQYLYRVTSRGYGGDYRLAVIETRPAKGTNPLTAAFGKDAAGAALYKNGHPATLDMLERWDVLMYYESAGVVEASNIRLVGYYGWSGSDHIRLFGKTFAVLPEAASKIKDFSTGVSLTFFLSPDGESIADARLPSVVSTTPITLGGEGKVDVAGTLTLSSSPGAHAVGQVGRFSGSTANSMYFTAVSTKDGGVWGDFNVTARTLGTTPLAPWCAVYDQVGNTGRAIQIALSDIPAGRISARNILYAETGDNGYVTAIILNNATGDAYQYGFAHVTPGVGEDSLDEVGLSLDGKHPYATYKVGPVGSPRSGTAVGISLINAITDGSPLIHDIVTCVKYSDLARADFNGVESVTVNRLDIPLSARATDVFVPHLNDTIPLKDALFYCKRFDVYTDPMEYKVRIIVGWP